MRHAVVVAVVVEGDDLAFEQVEQRRRLDLVPPGEVGLVLGRGDGPPVLPVEHLVPPAVEHRAVEGAVEHRLHAARAARLLGSAGCVEPHVAALDQGPGHGDVVVLDERDPVAHVDLAGEHRHLADQLLSLLVGRMGLAREHQLHGSVGRQHQGAEAIRLGQQQRGPLVGREAAGEADGEHVGIELAGPSLAQELDEPPAAGAPERPEPLVVVGDGHLGRPPCGRVHAVGDGVDGHVERGKHAPAHGGVQAGHGVGPPRQTEAHDRHVEGSVGSLVGLVAHGHQSVEVGTAFFGPPPEIALHQRPGEAVDASRHRRVGREDAAAPYRGHRVLEREAVLDDGLTDALEGEEAGVALVAVEDLRLQAQPAQQPHAADPQNDLLAQPVLGVAAVEPVGDAVGVEEEERHSSHPQPPGPCPHRGAGEVDLDLGLRRHQADGVGVEVVVALVLPTPFVEGLMEVALPVEEADADEGDAEVAGRLEVVARQHSQAPRVLREGLGDAELG